MKKDKQQLLFAFGISALVVGVMIFIHLYGYFFKEDFTAYGIEPRTLSGLWGLISAPFIHGSFQHLFSNIPPFFVLMAGILYYYKDISLKVILGTLFLTNIWVWLFARHSIHIGASGLLYGFAFFLFFSGVLRKNKNALRIALAVALFYGGLVQGIFPTDPHISWESHLCGAVAGTFFAYITRNQGPKADPPYWQNEPEVETGIWDYKNGEPPEGFIYK